MSPPPTPQQLSEVYDHARLAYPKECCGMLRRPTGSNDGVRRCDNAVDQLTAQGASDRTTATGFAFGSADLLFLARSLDTPHPVEVIYHSHPDVGAYFSQEDARNAVVDGQPVYPVKHLVVDVTAQGVLGSILFEFASDEGGYVAVQRFGSPRDRQTSGAPETG